MQPRPPSDLPPPQRDNTAGLILSGGQSRRMGGTDKAFTQLYGTSLIEHVRARLQPQVSTLWLNPSSDDNRYQTMGAALIYDAPAFAGMGPMAGIHAGLCASRDAGFDWLLVSPCDVPFLPADLHSRLAQAAFRTRRSAYVALSQGRTHYGCCLLDSGLVDAIGTQLESGEKRLGTWLQNLKALAVDFSDQPQGFVNINSRHDLAIASQRGEEFLA